MKNWRVILNYCVAVSFGTMTQFRKCFFACHVKKIVFCFRSDRASEKRKFDFKVILSVFFYLI